METLYRFYEGILKEKLRKPFVHILFGARQTGKSTLMHALLGPGAVKIDLSDPRERARFSAKPGTIIELCQALPGIPEPSVIFIDEAQTVPALFDAVQYLYDTSKTRYRFILCGSSARKLRESGANLLPGRSMRHLLFPLIPEEYQTQDKPNDQPLLAVGTQEAVQGKKFPHRSIQDRLAFGDLPGIALLKADEDRADILSSYATAYLEEEIRREMIIKDWGRFLRFLSFAAAESGGIVNVSAVSRETGIASATIKSYYQLLEDMFIGFTVKAFSGSPRKSALSSPRFFFFDLGVRNAAAGIPLAKDSVNANPGPLFVQWVGLQLQRKISYGSPASLSYFRTSDGAEIDFILERGNELIPIEVKWTENPTVKDARHLKSFMADHKDRCERGYIVSRCPHVLALTDNIRAIPWTMI
jgi:predicted AAA+ superfamily ATPase